MAGNYTVDVSVALKAQQASIKNIRKQIEAEFGEVDFNSSVGKKLAKLFDQFDNRISNMDSILGKGVLNTNDLGKLASLFDSMNMIVGQMHSAAGRAPMVDLGLDPADFPELVAAMEQVKKLQAEMAAESKKSSKETLTAMNKQAALDKLNNLQNTKASQDKSLHENAAILEAEHEQRIEAEKRLQQELDSLEAKRKSKQQERDREQRMAAEAEEAARKKEIELKDKQALSRNSVDKMTGQKGKALNAQKKSIQSFLEEVYSESAVAAQNHLSESNLAGSLLKAMFSPDELEGMAEYTAQQLREAFQKKLFSSDGNSVNQDAAQFFGSKIQEWQKAHPGTVTQTQNSVTALRQQVSAHSQNADMADLDAKSVGIEIDQKTEELGNLQVEAANLHSAAVEIRAAAQAFQAALNKKYDPLLDQAGKGVAGAKQGAIDEAFPSSKPGNPVFSPQEPYREQGGIKQQEDADSFTAKMKSAISQWMGAREIIGYIKQGLRSAYQDIQNLDQAMTNIAVVTNMSTSDLWGKIDQYMGMAQQYGVTTQGVYEVSQLYFQQGLGEAEVMDATVETLKMARIAGMDYKDAADGMTVAIRGFNMEMQDAARVTDVYSKVAAITASDTQELVSAMSKTASSAASVGSSFENTTAMLAVMVEATRESPQNIGSAMKSIISRYGEMTKGLSEDSEGEEIDYNRVDTALKSIGISLKDAQGQFRDFDDVIFELSDKWDTLDSVTQRYIATIFAGNRQQSRFLALVSNADRLREVSEAAENSEDAGLLQYSKTLDSLETKINNIKTSFQQFYMDIFNGPLIGKGLDFINDIIKGFNKLGKFTTVLNIGSMIMGIKTMVSLIVKPFSQIATIIEQAIKEGFDKGKQHAQEGSQDVVESTQQGADTASGAGGALRRGNSTLNSLAERARNNYQGVMQDYGAVIQGAQILGGGLSFLGSHVAERNQTAGAALSGVGNMLSYGATGAQIGAIFGPVGAAVGAAGGALLGFFNMLATWPDKLEKAQEELAKAEEEAQEKQIERAEAKQRAEELETTIDKLEELSEHQYDSVEAQEEYIKANKQAAEQFPELASTFDSAGNAIISLQSAESALMSAREAATQATVEAANAEIAKLRAQKEVLELEQQERLEKVLQNRGANYGANFVGSAHHAFGDENYDQQMERAVISRGLLFRDVSEETQSFVNSALRMRMNGEVEGGLVTLDENLQQTTQAASALGFDFIGAMDGKLDLSNTRTTELLNQLLNTTSNEEAISFLLDNYGEMVWTEGSKATKSLAKWLGYDINTKEGYRDFHTFINEYKTGARTLNSVEGFLDDQYDTTANLYANNALNADEDRQQRIDSVSGLRNFLQTSVSEAQEAYRLEQAAQGNENAAPWTNEEVEEYLGIRSDGSLDMNGLTQKALDFEGIARMRGTLDEVNSLFQLAEAGKISRNDFEQSLAELNFDASEEGSFLQIYTDSIFSNISDIRDQTINALEAGSSIRWTPRIVGRDFQEVAFDDNILNGIAQRYYTSITDFKNYLEDQVDNGEMSLEQANRMAVEYADVWEATTQVPLKYRAKAQELVANADLTTTFGQATLLEEFEAAGFDESIPGMSQLFTSISGEGLYPFADNLITQYGTLQNNLKTGLEKMTEVLSAASEGTSLEEAEKIAKKVGLDTAELFSFQDGKYYAKDEEAFNKIYEAYDEDRTRKLNERLRQQQGILAQGRTYDSVQMEETIWVEEEGHMVPQSVMRDRRVETSSEEFLALMRQYEDAAVSWFEGLTVEQKELYDLQDTELGEDNSSIVSAYLGDYAEDVQELIDEETQYLFDETTKALKIGNRARELKASGVGEDKREAYSLLSSKGQTGYSADDIAALETYLGINAEDFATETGVGTGEYEIDTSLLSNLPIWVQNAINGIIEETMVDTSESISDLGGQVSQLGGPDKGAMAAAFVETANEFGRELIEEEYPKRIKEAAEGNQTSQVILKHSIARELGKDFDSPEVQEAYRDLISSYKDGAVEAEKEIIDLQIKALDGSITQGEKDLLTDADGSIDVSGLVEGTQEAISALVQRIIDNTNLSFEDKVDNLQKVYDVGLEDLLGYETSIAETLTSREGFSRSDATSMMAELTALGVKTTGLFEQSADGTQFYLNNQNEIISELIAATSDESLSHEQRASASNLLKQISYIRQWQPYELADSMGSTIEEMANATEISTVEMRDFYKELTGRDISVEDAQRLAAELNELDPVARIEQLVAIARQSGINVEGLEERLAETAANVLDTIIEAISNGMSSIGEGLSGTLSFASLNELMQKYNLSIQDSFGTASGATLGEQDRRNLITAMYQEAKASGLQTGFGDQLWETFRDSENNPFAGYNALEEELSNARSILAEASTQNLLAQQQAETISASTEERRAALALMGEAGAEELAAIEATVDAAQQMASGTAEAAEEARAYAEALEQARAAAMFDENAYEFTFMEQDATSGLTKNADNFINQIDAVKAAFQSFKNDESIGYQDFYNMMDFLNSTGQWVTFSETVGMAGRDYEDFVNSVVANTDEWGKVDIGGVAAEMGISVDAAMTAMSDSMKSGLIEVAQQQVDYLTGLENMLQAMAALESVGDINLGMNLTMRGQTQSAEYWINEWNNLDDAERKEVILALKTQGSGIFNEDGSINARLAEAMDGIFGEGFSSNVFQFDESEDLTELSSEMSGYFLQATAVLNKAMEDGSGETAQGVAHAMQAAKEAYLTQAGLSLEELSESQRIELAKLIAEAAKNAKPLDLADFSQRYQEALLAGETQVTLPDGPTIQLNWDGQATIIPPSGEEADYDIEASLARWEEQYNASLQDPSAYFHFTGVVNGQLTYEIIPTEVRTFLSQQFTPEALTVNLADGTPVQVQVNPNSGSVTVVGPEGRELTGSEITEAANTFLTQAGASAEGIFVEGADQAAGTVSFGVQVQPGLSDTELLTQIAAGIANIDTALSEGFEVRLTDQATSVLDAIQANYDELREYFSTNPLEIPVEQVGGISIPNGSSGTPDSSSGTPTVSSGPISYTGTMNGLAFADGSLGRLYSGATLANKALVGELGPELAVYDGQYHMLGANGAEFVDLPSDAIIFNHLQTQGILRGQMNIRGTAMADGNVSGPAYAGGISAALSAVSRAKSVWQGLLSSLTAADLLDNGGGGGGGGGGESLKAHIADLQEWYNLSRQIAKIESEINTLISKRNNLTDGHEYLRNLRETQRLLDDQVNTQKDLLRFQELQLQRQAEHINTNEIWSQFLKVDENGLLQYIEGNETNGGKGALEVLSKMNEMSGEEQLAYVQSLGWSYTTTDGEELEEAQLVAKFYEELQKQIDDYDALADTVNEAESALEDLEGQINEIEKEIRDNEIDLSQEIYDIIVDAWKENIENLKEQNDLIKEANEAYAQGIEKAISAERELYEQNQSIQEREQMQRQLALMRRSGGSASEIANLEAQLDEKLKEEYFANQEKALEDIREANERQVELMEQQVKIQEEQLKYQEENGVIWSKVYEVMLGTDAEILQFMQGNSTEFFQKSYLQQEDMLTEWAKKIGIYTEERQRENYMAEAATTFGNVWNNETGRGLQGAYNRAGAGQQQKWQREYNDTYASKMLEGKTQEEALELAQTEFYEHIRNWLAEEEDRKNRAAQAAASGSSNDDDSGSSSQKTEYNRYVKVKDADGNEVGIVVSYSEMKKLKEQGKITNTGVRTEARKTSRTEREALGLSTGGLVDETGFAILHGSPSRPERVLSAEQTRILEEGLAMNAGRGTKLQEALQGFAYSLGSSIQSSIASVIKDSNNVNAFNIQPGAVVLQIAELNDKYDVDELFNDVADRLYSIAAKSSGRSVSRR